jgi:ABC-2 type transport system ATP-binding protein
MKQRLCLAKTLLHDPALLLLDEPASGLDPRARVEIRELLKELKKMKKTILISSHILPELHDFCTSIGIIEKGTLVANGSIAEIEARLSSSRRYRVTSLDPPDRIQAFLAAQGIESTLEGGAAEFESTLSEEEIASLLARLVREDLRITQFLQVTANLEDLFMKITRGEVQ